MNIVVAGKVFVSSLLDGSTLPRCGVIQAETLTELDADDTVLIVGEGAMLPERISVMAAVVNADSGFDSSKLSGTAVITCGMGSRNTVSVTSRTAEYITVSLNRSVHTLRGLCEPLELPLPVRIGVDEYSYMAAFAASLLLGNIE